MSQEHSNRDEILANFQIVTGIEDYGKALSELEACNWDLVKAINRILKDDQDHVSSDSSLVNEHIASSSSFHHSHFSHTDDTDVIEVDNEDRPELYPAFLRPNVISHSKPNTDADLLNSSLMSIPSTSNSQPDVIDINIKIRYEESDEENCPFPVEIPESTTVAEFQTVLHQLLGIPPCSQVLDGFQKSVYPDTVITRDVLPKNRSLTLITNSTMNTQSSSNMVERETNSIHDCTLLIHDKENKKDYKLPYRSNKLIAEIKSDVFDLSAIPVRHQLWTGWPPNLNDMSTLQSVGIPKEHHLTVSQNNVSENTPKLQHTNMRDASEENSSADEFEDASSELIHDDFLVLEDTPSSHSNQPLIPPDVEDEQTGVLSFVRQFENRFSSTYPLFYQGVLEAALRESVMLPAKKRKLLALYLHHDKSVSANVFCSQSLCSEAIVDYLSNNYIIWGWDITHESNKQRLMNIVNSKLGVQAMNTIKDINLEKLPALLIINRNRGAVEILSVTYGSSTLDEVMTNLVHATELFEDQKKGEVREENLREQRETVKAEQDAAYNASLEADRAKAEAKRKAELQAREERERQQSIREQEEMMKEAVRASLEMELPVEPSLDSNKPIVALRFRTPKSSLTRRFTNDTILQVVLNYLSVKGYPPDEYKYITTYPRKCLTSLNPEKTLEELGIPHQDTVTIEERIEGQD